MKCAAPVVKKPVEKELKPHRSLNNRQQENHDACIRYVSQGVGNGYYEIFVAIKFKMTIQDKKL